MPRICCTEYFTYVSGTNQELHRAKEQIWNLNGSKGKISVYIQGLLPTNLQASGTQTFFAKKHLLTYKPGDDASKAARVSAKRVGERAIASNADQQDGRYGKNILLPKGSTFVYCHEMTPSELVEAFYAALTSQKWPSNTYSHARVWFKGNYVSRMSSSGSESSVRDWMDIGFTANTTNDVFAITHGQ